jgi:hypothetical protein
MEGSIGIVQFIKLRCHSSRRVMHHGQCSLRKHNKDRLLPTKQILMNWPLEFLRIDRTSYQDISFTL